MTQEDKELLFKDLCARLPYGVIVHTDYKDVKLDRNHRGIGMLYYEHYSEEAKKQCGYNENDFSIILSGCYYGDNIKPYLRPLSSLAGEELEECRATCKNRPVGGSVLDYATIETFDWLNTHQFNYRLPSRLFIEVTEENNPYK